MDKGEALVAEAFPLLNRLVRRDRKFDTEYFNSLITAQQFRYPYAEIDRLFEIPGSLLDWGCGRGHLSYYLLTRGYRVSSFSIQPRPVLFDALTQDMASRHEFLSGSEDEPTALPYPDDRFDGVISCGVLEHVRESGGTEAGSLAEIRRILKPGGYFLCSAFPNRFSVQQIAATLIFGLKYRKIPYTVKYHKYRYSRQDVFTLARAAGLEMVGCRYYGMLPRNSFAMLPPRVRNSSRVSWLYNRIDMLLELGAPVFCTSHLFVLRRPA
ncbi:MAG: methyltransferase domain-containing protein [Chitinivibrionales bacterium]|nr:methyltransferase domain-containing protein [Chitinivibrionales bacterium]MBD3395753.1 methyltransferase domain-containing protein [Chitinivibrionales bacterium]